MSNELAEGAQANARALLFAFVAFAWATVAAASKQQDGICGGIDIWHELIPAWFAHIGVIELLLGVLCPTYGTPILNIIKYAGIIHIMLMEPTSKCMPSRAPGRHGLRYRATQCSTSGLHLACTSATRSSMVSVATSTRRPDYGSSCSKVGLSNC